MPIYTLPLLRSKVYVVNSPALVQPILRSKSLSFEPFILEFSPKLLALRPSTVDVIKSRDPVTGISVVEEMITALHNSMLADSLRAMNTAALGYLTAALDPLAAGAFGGAASRTQTLPNLWLYLRDLLTLSTTDVLWSRATNPFRGERALINDLWRYDELIPELITSPFPKVTVKEGWDARRRMQAALGDWYDANYDVDFDAATTPPEDPRWIAEITRRRASVLRRHGISARDIGDVELSLAHVASQNAIPTLFWVMANVLSRPEWVARVRGEVEAIIEFEQPTEENGKKTAKIDMAALEKQTPFLVACYNEAMRLGTHSPGTRRVMEDTIISPLAGEGSTSDGAEPPPAPEYLLRKGVDVQIPVCVMHRKGSVWGNNSNDTSKESPSSPSAAVSWSPDFDPSNFLPSAAERTRKAAFTPFGGGKHLCPGRRFAFVEILAVVCILITGFDMEPLQPDEQGRFKVPAMRLVRLGAGVGQPVNYGEGTGVRVRRRPGWEGVRWKFTA